MVTIICRAVGRKDWNELITYPYGEEDVRYLIGVSNMAMGGSVFCTEGLPTGTVWAEFDNFVINAAQEIIEDEI